MNRMKTAMIVMMALGIVTGAGAQEAPQYNIYFGTTHGHTAYSSDAQQENNTLAINFAEAKKNGFQFYAITDHSHRETFTTASYADTWAQSLKFTEKDFVPLPGHEYSDNDGPGGKGHSNCFNTRGFLNALAPGNDLPKYYDWLVAEGKKGLVAASFNHPSPAQYNGFDYYSDERREMITMLEVINGSKRAADNPNLVVGGLHYEAWLKAMEKGWRVAPVAALDAHSPNAIAKVEYRTGVLAGQLTRESLLEAMKNRRTYATYDRNLHVIYTANGKVMGSVLKGAETGGKLKIEVKAWDPDKGEAKDRITKIEILGEGGKVVETKTFGEGTHEAAWTCEVWAKGKYYFLKVYTAELGDKPTAYLAPVWIEQ